MKIYEALDVGRALVAQPAATLALIARHTDDFTGRPAESCGNESGTTGCRTHRRTQAFVSRTNNKTTL